ncbi:hypothetical protein KC866_03550 [Patescibacteria group bacterium]|nr:hypothetical protein [Patescibacteria group bacterium]
MEEFNFHQIEDSSHENKEEKNEALETVSIELIEKMKEVQKDLNEAPKESINQEAMRSVLAQYRRNVVVFLGLIASYIGLNVYMAQDFNESVDDVRNLTQQISATIDENTNEQLPKLNELVETYERFNTELDSLINEQGK